MNVSSSSFLRSSLLALVTGAALLACAADPASDPASGEDPGQDEADLTSGKDVSADYVGRYAPPANAAAGSPSLLLLKKDKHYALTTASGTEEGSFVVRASGSTVQLRLTPAKGAARTYRATLGSGFRPLLTLSRYAATWTFERELVSCASVNCLAGFACTVEERDGVPGPACNPVSPTWKLAFAAQDLWGVTFANTITTGMFPGVQKPLYCQIHVANAQIGCGPTGLDFPKVWAAIQADGTFSVAYGNPGQTGGELAGSIGQGGKVTLTRFRDTECFQTSSSWCEQHDTSGGNVPATSTAFALCSTPGQSWDNGDWVAGYMLDCAQCHGQCTGGR